MYIHIEPNKDAYLIPEERQITFYINGVICYDPNYPDGAEVPGYSMRPTNMEYLGKADEHSTAMKIRSLMKQGVEIK